jgi:hypothetical protein
MPRALRRRPPGIFEASAKRVRLPRDIGSQTRSLYHGNVIPADDSAGMSRFVVHLDALSSDCPITDPAAVARGSCSAMR